MGLSYPFSISRSSLSFSLSLSSLSLSLSPLLSSPLLSPFSLIQKMLVSESSERISVQGILDHPWMQTGNTNVSKPDEPLLIREGKVTPELHTKIIEKMVEGEFAETEVILKWVFSSGIVWVFVDCALNKNSVRVAMNMP